MSITLNLEIDPRLRFEDLRKVFDAAGLDGVEADDSEIKADFRESRMAVSAQRRDDLPDLLIEGLDSPDRWQVGSRVIFHYQIATPELCNQEVSRFIKVLELASPAYFALSFQYENVYALRDRRGLRFVDGAGLE